MGMIFLIAVSLLAAAAVACLFACRARSRSPHAASREYVCINEGWRFYRGDTSGAQTGGFDDNGWDRINLPHTWNNLDGQDGGNDYYRGAGWYRTRVMIDGRHDGKAVFLQFDGANSVADVFVNGVHVGTHEGGYARFRFDITQHLVFGAENVLAVKVDNSHNADIAPLSADFTFFGGLYRDGYLLMANTLHFDPLDFASPGVFVTQQNVSASSARLRVAAKIRNSGSSDRTFALHTVIANAEGQSVAASESGASIGAQAACALTQDITLESPRLWNGLGDPYLYRVRVEIREGEKRLDEVELPLGVRFFSVDPAEGFFLNGTYLDLHGVCRHQDRKDKGWAISRDNHREDFMQIREMGATMVRLAHYQHDQYFYDLCDRHGMVVWAEIPLVNQITESAPFYDNAKQQLRELIRQNYHHPSILFWGIHNEVTSTPGPDATRLVGELADVARQEDPARLSTAASNSGQWDHQTNWESNIIAWNRYDGWYSGSIGDFALWADTIHATYPRRCIGVSEYGAGANPSHHEPAPSSVPHAGNWHPEEFQNRFHEEYWIAMKSRPFLWCRIVWNMFDFASERRNEGGQPGINDKGLVTYDRGLKKDAFFWYKANWSAEPVVHIVSSRAAHQQPQPVDVKVYSNCERVELFVDAESHGEKTGDNMRFTWPGITVGPGTTIRALGRRGDQEAADACSWDSACGASTPLGITR